MVSWIGGPGDEDDIDPEIAVSSTHGRTIMMEKGSPTAWLSTTVVVDPENCR